jgi:2-methylcitrate dehydratase PrpD
MAAQSKTPITDRISKYLAAAPTMPLSPLVAERARNHLLDTIAAIVSGAHLDPGRITVSYARKYGGRPEATVAGTDLRTDVHTAALANGMCAHADETDDFHAASVTHPGSTVVPAALALAELNHVSGAQFLRAVVAGYEICCRMVMAIDALRTFGEGRATHGLGGLFGAAAASGVVLNFEEEQIPHLLSYTIQQASGLVCWRRDPDHIEKAFDFSGGPTRDGVQAATMVAHGMTGVVDALEGPLGFFPVFGRGVDPAPAWRGLEETPMILDCAIKKWCVGSPNQSVLDATVALIENHKVRAQDVARMRLIMPDDRLHIVSNKDMPDVCVEHLAAIAMLDGGVSFEAAHDYARMQDPVVLAFRQKIELVPNPELTRAVPARQAIVEIETTSGDRLRHHAKAVRGTPENPMTEAEVEAKALDLILPVLGEDRAKGLILALGKLADLRSVRELRPLLKA